MTLPGGSNPADVLFKLAKGRGLANPTFEQVTSKCFGNILLMLSLCHDIYWVGSSVGL